MHTQQLLNEQMSTCLKGEKFDLGWHVGTKSDLYTDWAPRVTAGGHLSPTTHWGKCCSLRTSATVDRQDAMVTNVVTGTWRLEFCYCYCFAFCYNVLTMHIIVIWMWNNSQRPKDWGLGPQSREVQRTFGKLLHYEGPEQISGLIHR